MTNPNGTTGKGPETMERSEAVATPTIVDACTSTESAVEVNVRDVPRKVETIVTQKTTTVRVALTTPADASKRASSNDKKRPVAVPMKQNSKSAITATGSRRGDEKIESSSLPTSSSKVIAALPIQTKAQKTGGVDELYANSTSMVTPTPMSLPLVERKNDGGNDRVTVDKKPNKPLVSESSSSNVRSPGNTKVCKRDVPPTNFSMISTKNKNKATTSTAATPQQKQSIASTSSSNPVVTKKNLVANLSSTNNTSRTQVASTPTSDMDESTNSLGDEELKRQRAPLTTKYGPYITCSDTSLADARRRLQIALDQTRQLRASFTERVYGKYRVCLQPPPQTQDIIKALKDDPSVMCKKIELELKRITDEKNVEKKDSQKVATISDAVAVPAQSMPSTFATISSAPNAVGANNNNNSNVVASATSSVDNAEQFLYVTSGLSLIILPEDDMSQIDMGVYQDRAPVNPKTGQRIRSISQAAAISGTLMLERARQGKVARTERMKRLQQKVDKLAHNFFDSHYKSSVAQFKTAVIEVQSSASSTAKPPVPTAKNPPSIPQKTKSKVPGSRSRSGSKSTEGKKLAGVKRSAAPKTGTKVPAGQTAAGAKVIRARVQTPMTLQTLLNLNPIHEELRTDTKYSAATLAMMECGVGAYQGPTTQYHKNTPHRFKHPFPDSLGGRRRPVTSAGGVVDSSNATNLQLTLPPIPSVKERRRYKRTSVLSRKEGGTTRAATSIRKILDQFTPSANKAVVAIESSETQENPLLCRPKKQRKISEIGFVRGLYLDSLNEGRTRVGGATTESGKNDSIGIDSTLTLNVLKAVGLIKSSVSNDSKPERSSFQTSLASSLFKEIPSTGTGPYSDSILTLKDLEQKLSTQKQSFTAAFCSDADAIDIEHGLEAQGTERENEYQKIEPKTSALLALRGGGSGNNNDVNKSVKSPDRKPNSGGSAANNSKAGKSSKRNSITSKNPPMNAATAQTSLLHQSLLREELLQQQQQRLASLQAQGVVHQQRSVQLQAQLQTADHFRQTSALQLARQFNLSRLQVHGHSGAGDLADFMGVMHQSSQAQAAYRWAPPSAVAVATSNNLVALGLNPSGVGGLTVDDRTRAMYAREQQNYAVRIAQAQRQQQQQQQHALLFRGMAAVENQFAQPAYSRIPGQLVSSTAAARMVRQGNQSRAINASPKKITQDNNNASQEKKLGSKDSHKDAPAELNLPKSEPSQKIERKAQKNNNNNMHKQIKASDKLVDDGESSVSPKKKRKIPPSKGNVVSKTEKRQRTSSVGNSNDLPKVPSSATIEPESPGESIKSKAVEKKIAHDIIHKITPAKNLDPNQVQPIPSVTGKDDQPLIPIGAARKGESQKNVLKATIGLQFCVPNTPFGMSTDFATTVLAGRCHEAIGVSVYRDLAVEGLRVVNYITSAGMAVPIPKTIVMNPLKERMNGLVFRNSNVGSMPASSREIIAAVILLWLWRNQEGCFQRAFAKSGRIDVDPECKWFVNAAVNKAVTALSNEVIGSTSRANGLTTALLAHKTKSSTGLKGFHEKVEQDSLKQTTTKIDLLTASVVSKSLNMTLVLNEEMNSAIPQFNNLVDYLDECRKLALFAKSQERALLAAVVSRKAVMSLSFSHAYVSAIVRAGEALGHGALFEVVQNEKCGVSTMIPYDVFTDEYGAWEDPCRPSIGFNEGLTGDDLTRRAHTRAIIHKSLKKLQDRQNVKGGAQNIGPYVDHISSTATSSGTKGTSGLSRGASNRRRSSLSEPLIQPGSGSAVATSWALYTPNHQSPSLDWDVNATDNAPYGRYDKGTRPRSLSLAQGAAILRNSGRGQRRRRSQSTGPSNVQREQADKSSIEKEDNKQNLDKDRRSTREIPWEDVAGIFQKVELPASIKEQKQREAKMSSKQRTIFAPIVRMPDSIPIVNDDESDAEEDLSDEAILENHRVVLDKMKARLSSYMESKKRSNQDRRKSRDKSNK